jgi:hypothetical protein
MGVNALGVDLDEGMLSACSENGLQVVHGDAIAHLSSLENNSQLIVSAFHMVEHISFDELRHLVQEAHRVLKPGGLLIMETPNPENIMVATCSFYLDPTHVRPIPPDLLLFTTEFYNFFRSKIVRVQEWSEIKTTNTLGISHVLGGTSPDYAIVAQKSASSEILSKCNEAFSCEYGVDVSTLALKYSNQQHQVFSDLQSRLQKIDHDIERINNAISWVLGPRKWFGIQHRKLKQEGVGARLKAITNKIYLRTLGRINMLKDPESPLRSAIFSIAPNLGQPVEKPSNSNPNANNELSVGAEKIFNKLNKVDINADSD